MRYWVVLAESALEAAVGATGFAAHATVVRSESKRKFLSAQFAAVCIVESVLRSHCKHLGQLVEALCLADVLYLLDLGGDESG